jgi:acylphosphatase
MGEMRRANIRIKGNVQMAGFRTFIKNIADSLNVKGFAENLEDGSVKVVCEGEEEGIKELINSIKENPPSFARIDDVSVESEDYKGEFTSFERRGNDIPQKATLDDLLGVLKSFDSKAEKLVSILSDTNVTLKSVKEDTSSIKEDTSSIKEDTKLIPGIKENTEKMLEKQDDTVGELKSLREDLKSYMENKFAKIEREIEGIKAKIGMI